MASTPVAHRPEIAGEQLREILSRPLPVLPSGSVWEVARELRAMQTRRAVTVWVHPGWTAVVGWILRRTPDCDPTVAAVHAVRNAERARSDPDYARCLAGYLRHVARRRSIEDRRAAHRTVELTWEPADETVRPDRLTASLAGEVNQLLEAGGIPIGDSVRDLIGSAVDVAVDWWDALATRTGLVGEELLEAARRSDGITASQRLASHFEGPAARPLVALFTGGDQKGRQARRTSGTEAGLLYWALLARQAGECGAPLPDPPVAVRRAWATHLRLIEDVTSPGAAAVTVGAGPTVAA